MTARETVVLPAGGALSLPRFCSETQAAMDKCITVNAPDKVGEDWTNEK